MPPFQRRIRHWSSGSVPPSKPFAPIAPAAQPSHWHVSELPSPDSLLPALVRYSVTTCAARQMFPLGTHRHGYPFCVPHSTGLYKFLCSTGQQCATPSRSCRTIWVIVQYPQLSGNTRLSSAVSVSHSVSHSVCPSVCLSVCLSVNLSASQPPADRNTVGIGPVGAASPLEYLPTYLPTYLVGSNDSGNKFLNTVDR